MSTLRVTTIQNTSGVEVYTAKAWVNFNGQGIVAIRGSGNVSSITDNGTGDYTVNFTNAFADTNYAAQATGHAGGGFIAYYGNATPTTTAVRVIFSTTTTNSDPLIAAIAVFR